MRAPRRRIARRCDCDEERPSLPPPGVRRRPAGARSGAILERARRLGHRPPVSRASPPTPGGLRPAVQRVVDLDKTRATENGRYFVDPGATHRLYSRQNTAAPAPRTLYGRSGDVSTLGTPLFVWHPNVRLISQQEAQKKPDPGALAAYTEAMFRNIPARHQPSLGVLGKNDCDFFAGTLQYLIAKERNDFADEEVGDTTVDLEKQDAPVLGVGDRMKHKFEGQQQCGHHAATVVAKDGASLVTLEAHVSKDIQRPEFHIRNGVTGFVQDNDPLGQRNLGKKVEFRFLADLTEDETAGELGKAKTRYRRITGKERVRGMEPSDFLGTGLGVTEEPARERRRGMAVTAIGRLLRHNSWSSQGVGIFKIAITPSGVGSLKSVISGPGSYGRKLRELKRIATERLKKQEGHRSEATQALYELLAGLDVAAPDLQALDHDLEQVEQKL